MFQNFSKQIKKNEYSAVSNNDQPSVTTKNDHFDRRHSYNDNTSQTRPLSLLYIISLEKDSIENIIFIYLFLLPCEKGVCDSFITYHSVFVVLQKEEFDFPIKIIVFIYFLMEVEG